MPKQGRVSLKEIKFDNPENSHSVRAYMIYIDSNEFVHLYVDEDSYAISWFGLIEIANFHNIIFDTLIPGVLIDNGYHKVLDLTQVSSLDSKARFIVSGAEEAEINEHDSVTLKSFDSIYPNKLTAYNEILSKPDNIKFVRYDISVHLHSVPNPINFSFTADTSNSKYLELSIKQAHKQIGLENIMSWIGKSHIYNFQSLESDYGLAKDISELFTENMYIKG